MLTLLYLSERWRHRYGRSIPPVGKVSSHSKLTLELTLELALEEQPLPFADQTTTRIVADWKRTVWMWGAPFDISVGVMGIAALVIHKYSIYQTVSFWIGKPNLLLIINVEPHINCLSIQRIFISKETGSAPCCSHYLNHLLWSYIESLIALLCHGNVLFSSKLCL